MTSLEPAIALDHVAIIVSDMDTMIAFYRDILGLEVIRSGEVAEEVMSRLAGDGAVKARFAFLGRGQSAKIEFGEFVPGGAKPNGADHYNTIGIRHIAFNVTNLAAIQQRIALSAYPNDLRIEEIEAAGAVSILKRGLMRDPEGNTIEFIETAHIVE